MITLILAECELERVPKSLRKQPGICDRNGRRAVILDSNYHHRAMRTLPDAYRRGRPDIVHICLLNALESPLCKEGDLKVFIHTRNDEVIYIDPSWRVPKAYHRFIGLMEQLFVQGHIDAGDTELLRLEHKTLNDLIREESCGLPVKVMHAGGAPYQSGEDAVIVIGGFPHGDFSSALPYPKYSMYSEELVAWSVVNHVIYAK